MLEIAASAGERESITFPGMEIRSALPPRDEAESWQVENDLRSAQERKTGPPPAELESVARVYRQAINGKPVEAVRFYLGTSYRTAARRVEQARAAGLLPPTRQGKKEA
jgi:hypothetical protein